MLLLLLLCYRGSYHFLVYLFGCNVSLFHVYFLLYSCLWVKSLAIDYEVWMISRASLNLDLIFHWLLKPFILFYSISTIFTVFSSLYTGCCILYVVYWTLYTGCCILNVWYLSIMYAFAGMFFYNYRFHWCDFVCC